MKLISLAIIFFTMSLVSVHAADYDYKCIADKLQARNSDIYSGLSEADVISMLTIPEMFGHYDAVNASRECESSKEVCGGNLEAQFIGKVKKLNIFTSTTNNTKFSTFEIKDIIFYSKNQLCPLELEEALKAVVFVESSTSLNNEDAISGVLIYSPKLKQFTIE